MGIRERIKGILTRRCEEQYDNALESKKVTYEEWLAKSACSQAARPHSRQDWGNILLLQACEGEMTEEAPEVIRDYFEQHPEVVIAYGDEDVKDPDTGKLRQPWFKPDWSPDTFLSELYWGNVIAIRRSWLETLPYIQAEALTEDMDEETVKKTLAPLVVAAGGFEPGCRTIGHIPQVLFHSVDSRLQTRCRAISMEAAVKDISPDDRAEEALRAADRLPMVSIIIPSKDHPQILHRCLESVYNTMGRTACEILVVDNGSSEKNRQEVEGFLKEAPVPTTYLYRPMEFHFSKMCNLGARHAKGEFLLFLNDDVEMCCQDFAERMVKKAAQPHAGAVGIKLYYPESRRIQHDGIVNLPMGPVHKLQFLEDDQDYYYGFNAIDRNVIAVTGACLMVHRDKFEAAGGMSEELPVAFNDVDLCFWLWELGYHNILLNSVHGYHHESLSRGDDESPQKLQRLLNEKAKLYRRHPKLAFGADPYYSMSLNREGLDTGIRPAYLTAGNTIQVSAPVKKQLSLKKYRPDNCLLYRVERCEEECIQGYGVVLGDNNACYDRTLVLWRLEDAAQEQGDEARKTEDAAGKPEAALREPKGKITCYCIPLTGQYRPELTENMMDQRNVALCGFWWKPEQGTLPEGRYCLGMTACSRAGGTRLINWSSHVLQTGRKGWKEE